MLALTRKRKLSDPVVLLGNQPLLVKSVWKYLGVHVDRTLNWGHNTRQFYDAALKRFNKLELISHSAQGAKAFVLRNAFAATVRCKVEYGSEVWGDLSSVKAALLDSVQHRSMCRVLGVNCKSHRSDVCVESFLPPPSVRRDVQLLRYC